MFCDASCRVSVYNTNIQPLAMRSVYSLTEVGGCWARKLSWAIQLPGFIGENKRERVSRLCSFQLVRQMRSQHTSRFCIVLRWRTELIIVTSTDYLPFPGRIYKFMNFAVRNPHQEAIHNDDAYAGYSKQVCHGLQRSSSKPVVSGDNYFYFASITRMHRSLELSYEHKTIETFQQ